MPTPVTAIPGIGPATADLLGKHGFTSAESIAETSVEKLSLVPGFGEIRAVNTIKAAADAVSSEPAAATKAEAASTDEPKTKTKKEKAEKEKSELQKQETELENRISTLDESRDAAEIAAVSFHAQLRLAVSHSWLSSRATSRCGSGFAMLCCAAPSCWVVNVAQSSGGWFG